MNHQYKGDKTTGMDEISQVASVKGRHQGQNQ